MSEEQLIEMINKQRDENGVDMLTELEVLLDNEIIELRKKLRKKQNSIDEVIKLIESDYFEDGSFNNYNKVMNLLKGENNE